MHNSTVTTPKSQHHDLDTHSVLAHLVQARLLLLRQLRRGATLRDRRLLKLCDRIRQIVIDLEHEVRQ
jgi:hypothetical protein